MKEKLKKIFRTIVYILGIVFIPLVVLIPYVFIYKKLKDSNRKLTIYPKFEVVNVENTDAVDVNVLSDSVRIGKEILTKIRGSHDEGSTQ